MTAFFAIWNSQVVNAESSVKPGKPAVDLEEDVLRQILGQATVVDEAVQVREDEPLIGVDDHGERLLIAPLRTAEDRRVGLR